MNKREKEIMNITLWRLAKNYIRKENNGYGKDWLNGYYSALLSLSWALKVDLNQLLIDIQDGKIFEDININSKICK